MHCHPSFHLASSWLSRARAAQLIVFGHFVRSTTGRYFGSLDYNVYAVNATTGEGLWMYETGLYVSSVPAVANGTVYVERNIYVGGHKRESCMQRSVVQRSVSTGNAGSKVYVRTRTRNLVSVIFQRTRGVLASSYER